MWRKGFYLMVMAVFTIIAAPNISNAAGGTGAVAAIVAGEQKANNKAAALMYKSTISPEVFRSADKFMSEKFPEAQVKGDWQVDSTGFVRYFGNSTRMVLKWDGEFMVVRESFFTYKLFYKGDWTQWR